MNQRQNLGDEYLMAPFARQFLAMRSADKSSQTVKNYHKALSRFITYCSQHSGLPAEQLNFGQFSRVEFNGRFIYLEIRREFVQAFLNQMAPKSARQSAEVVLRVYFHYLVAEGVITQNPCRRKQHTRTHVPKQGLSLDEIVKYVSALKLTPIGLRAPITIQLAAGLRLGELLALRTSDVSLNDVGNWDISICREALKGRVAMKLPLPDLSKTLEEYFAWREGRPGESDHLFINDSGRRLTSRSVNQEIARIGEVAQLERRVTSHDMRRAFATLWSNQVEDSEILRRLSRHRESFTYWGYVKRAHAEEVRDATSQLSVVKLTKNFAGQLSKETPVNPDSINH